MKRTIDMSVGNPVQNILRFSVPVLLGTLFQQLYNMADTIVVGRFLGADALAAVGSTGSTVYLVIGFTSGLTQGFTILIAQAFGAHRLGELKKLVAHALTLTLLISVIFTVPTVIFCKLILQSLQTPEDIFSLAQSYLQTIFCGIICTMAYNVAAGILRAMGDSRTPLYFLIFSSFLNIGLDIFLIVQCSLGTAGAALATVISQGISALLSFGYMLRNYTHLRLARKDFRLQGNELWRMLRTGLPMALNQSITALGIMVLQGAVNTFGPTVIASFAAASKVENLVSQPMIALGSGISTYCAQNLGAGRIDRIRTGVRCTMAMSACVGGIGMVFYVLCARLMVQGFVADPSPELMAYADQYLFTSIWFLPALAWIFLFRNALVGLGNGAVSMLGGVLELCSRWMCIQILLPAFGFWCVRLTNPITWLAACGMFGFLYFRWERRQVFPEKCCPTQERSL